MISHPVRLRVLLGGLLALATACADSDFAGLTDPAPAGVEPAAGRGISLSGGAAPEPSASRSLLRSSAATSTTVAHSRTRQTTQTLVSIFFEGLPDNSPVPTTAHASFPGWLALIDIEAGGSGNFANERSPSAALFWNGVPHRFREITFAQPVAEVSLWYAGCRTCVENISVPEHTLTAFDRNGVALDSVKGDENAFKGRGDPTGDYNRWDQLSVSSRTADNLITRVRITGYSNTLGIDDLFYRQINFRPVPRPGGPYAVDEGQAVSFNGSASYDPLDSSGQQHPNGDPLTAFAWKFGDGNGASTANATHTYARSGSYTATLTVTDVNELTHTDSVPVLVRNLPPKVNAGPDREVQAGQPLTLQITFTDAGGSADSPWKYTIDWGDGKAATTGTVTSLGSTIGETYPRGTPASGTLVVYVEDRDGGVGVDTVRVTTLNQAPTASFTAPATVNEGATAAFDGSASTDPDTGPSSLTYAWTFGDGGTADDREPTHAYADDGTYPVTLRVTDPQGAVSQPATRQVKVENVAPAIHPVSGVPVSVAVGAAWQRTVTFSDPGRDRWTVTVDYGTGPAQVVTIPVGGARSFSVGRPYAAADDHTVTITVEDDDGDSDTLTFAVSAFSPNSAPVIRSATASVQAVCTGAAQVPVVLSATVEDPDGDPVTVQWKQGSAVIGTGTTLSKPFPLGSHTVLAVAADDQGAQATRQVQFTVRDRTPPTARLEATPGSIWPPNHKYHEVAVRGTASDDCGGVGTVTWTTGYVESSELDNEPGSGSGNTTGDIRVVRPDGTVLLSSNAAPRVPFRLGDRLEVRAERYGTAAPRVYTIRLRAKDASGNETEASATVTVDHSAKK